METIIPEKYTRDIEKALKILKAEGCEEIYLFGSIVTKTISNDSDIDIAVSGLEKKKFFKVYGKLLEELEHPFDLIGLDYNTPFSQMIKAKGPLHRVA